MTNSDATSKKRVESPTINPGQPRPVEETEKVPGNN